MRGVLPAAILLATGCVHLSGADDAAEALARGDVDAHHVVFVVEGMLKDLGSDWEEQVARGLGDDRRLAITVRYWTDPLGVLFNWGCVAPGKAIAVAADALADLHAASGSTRPLVLDAIGFSAGCEALLSAFERVERARFRRAVLVASSSLFLSREVARRIDEGVVGDVVAYWSPIDLTTLFAPLGAGQFGLRARCAGVRNERTLLPHSARFLGAREFERFRAELGGRLETPPDPDSFTASLADLLRRRGEDGRIDFDGRPREDCRAPAAVGSPP